MHNPSSNQSDAPVERTSPPPTIAPEVSPFRAWTRLRPPILLTLWLVLTLTALMSLGWNVWSVYSSFTKTTSEVVRFQELNGTVMHLDEALTMSARMAAATGDLRWEDRYRALEPKLQSALQEARALAPQAYLASGPERINEANNKLVKMEREVFNLVRRGNRRAADRVLLGEEYRAQKALYAGGIATSLDAVHRHLQTELNRYRAGIVNTGILGAVCLVFITGGWFGIVLHLRRHELGRQRTEAALQASTEQARVMVETAFDGVIGMDGDGRITLWNTQAERIFGWKREDVLNRSLAETIFPFSSQEVFRQGLASLRDQGADPFFNKRFESMARHRDGHEFPVELTVEAVPAGDGYRFSAFIRDMTQEKRSERQLALQYAVTHVLADARTTEEATTRIVQTICESQGWELGAFWNVDLQADVLRCRSVWHVPLPGLQDFAVASWEHVFAPGVGLPGRVWRHGRTAWIPDIQHDDNFPRATIATRVGLHGAFALPVKVGDNVYGVLEFFSREIRQPDQDLLQMAEDIGLKIGQFVDRKRAESALRETEEQLRQSQKMEAIGRLAGGVAHDFNNLLTVISGYTELLLAQVGSNEQLRAEVEEIKRAGTRAAALTSQLLAFSRRQVIAPQIVDLNAVAGNMEGMLRRLMGEDIIDLVTVQAADLGSIRADPSQMDQVIMNLAVNARDAMPSGGKLELETANVTFGPDSAARPSTLEPGDYVMLAITDTGCGMNNEVLSQAFEPFFTTKAKGKGTGLGLSTVYGIVKQNGGHIMVESEIKKGTTFKIYFPRVDRHARELTLEQAPHQSRSAGETILVVEDEPAVRGLVRDMLRQRGYQILEARDGINAQVVSKTHFGRIDLLLTDVVMPQKSGPEAAKELLADRPDMKVLYMSGYPDHPVFSQGPLDRGRLLLQKPFTPDALARKVREVLDMPVEQFHTYHLVG